MTRVEADSKVVRDLNKEERLKCALVGANIPRNKHRGWTRHLSDRTLIHIEIDPPRWNLIFPPIGMRHTDMQ
jgi:hypothetical protein